MRSRSGSNDKNANRSEAARQRRTERSQQRVDMASDRITNPVRPRPVTVRGNTFGTPIHRKAGTQRVRRQFYLTMDQAGAELRLPAITLVNPGWRLLSFLLAVLALVGIISVWNSPYFRIESVEVTGLQRLTPADLTGALALENLPIVEVDPQAARESLAKAFPELVDIQVAVFMPNIVTVSAVERQPVLAWQKGDQVRWVAADGVIFPARGEAEVPVTVHSENDLPLAAPPVETLAPAGEEAAAQAEEEAGDAPAAAEEQAGAPQKADPILLAAAQGLSQLLPPETTIVYHGQHGLGWDDPQGWQVYIGKKLTEFEAKYTVYQDVAGHLVAQGLFPSLVSVEHLNAPFYRLEQ
jgi:cell division protein FtsQ